MDESYELVSKEELEKLREENQSLKEKIEKNSTKIQKQDFSEIIEIIKQTLKETSINELNLINENLTHIKDLNKQTLSNIIDKNQAIDSRLENMINTLKDLVSYLSEALNEIDKGKKDFIENNSKQNNSENLQITQISDLNPFDNVNTELIMEKLEEIEEFMNNLKFLLSQIKPNNFSY